MEKVVVILDLRTEFSPFFPFAKTSIKTFIHEKLVHKPTCEFGLIGFGSPETSVMAETAEKEGLVTISPFEEVSLNALKHVDGMSAVICNGPLSSAFRKAADMVSGGVKKKTAKKRVIVLSTFASLPGYEQEACVSSLDIVRAEGVSCELVQCINNDTDKEANLWIHKLSSEQVAIRMVRNGYELKTCFPTKENKDAHVIYSGPLELGAGVVLDVKIVPKVKREPFPVLGNTSGESLNDSFSYNWSSPTPQTEKSGELYREDDIDQNFPVAVEKRVKGFKVCHTSMLLSTLPLVDEILLCLL
jgi:hypothetical protein